MFEVLLVLVIVGVLLWLLFRYVPIAEPVRTIIVIFVVLCIVFWLANLMGLVGHDIPLPHFGRGR